MIERFTLLLIALMSFSFSACSSQGFYGDKGYQAGSSEVLVQLTKKHFDTALQVAKERAESDVQDDLYQLPSSDIEVEEMFYIAQYERKNSPL